MRKNITLVLTLIFLTLVTSWPLGLYAQEIKFEPSDFKERRDKLVSQIPDGVAILANSRYSDFSYFTGVDIADAKIILIPRSIAQKAPNPEYWKTTLYLPSKDPRRGVWDDYQLFPGDEAVKETGIENTVDLSGFYSAVAAIGTLTDTIYLAYGTRVSSPERLPADLQFAESIKKILPQVQVKNLTPIIDNLRWGKSPKEIEVMRKACKITAEAFLEAAHATKPGIYENELEGLVNYIFRKNGAQAEFMIIGSGPNSCILHHMKNDRQMAGGELVLIDIGTSYKSLSTDLTRTIPVSGKYSPEQKKIYSVVLEAQKKAISIVKPGITLGDIYKVTMDVIDAAGYGKYFIHGPSHTLNGGSIFKPGTFGTSPATTYGKYKDEYFAANNPVVVGSMFTIEPGIYIPEKNLGVRIEDSILVTEDGCDVLTKDAPKEIDEIENLMKKKS